MKLALLVKEPAPTPLLPHLPHPLGPQHHWYHLGDIMPTKGVADSWKLSSNFITYSTCLLLRYPWTHSFMDHLLCWEFRTFFFFFLQQELITASQYFLFHHYYWVDKYIVEWEAILMRCKLNPRALEFVTNTLSTQPSAPVVKLMIIFTTLLGYRAWEINMFDLLVY